MRFRGARQVHYDAGPNTIPLVDVVMVILIFLMLVGQFGGVEQLLMMRLGDSKDGLSRAAAQPSTMPSAVVVRIRSLPSGGWSAQIGEEQIAEIGELRAVLGRLRASNERLILHAAADVAYEGVVQIYAAGAGAGFSRIDFAGE